MATQDHIHLSTSLGSAPENAPDIKWKVQQNGRQPIPNIIANHRRTLKSRLKLHRARDGSGNIIRLNDFKYILRVSDYWDMTKQERMDAILAMQGATVYLVDNIHADDGEDHTDDLKPMYFSILSDVTPLDPMLQVEYVTVELKDNSI